MKIITNNHYRHILYFCELEPSEQEELKNSYDTIEESTFFRYRGQVYDLNDFMRSADDRFEDWQGYHGDSYFSAVLIKFDESCEAVKVGLALS